MSDYTPLDPEGFKHYFLDGAEHSRVRDEFDLMVREVRARAYKDASRFAANALGGLDDETTSYVSLWLNDLAEGSRRGDLDD